ncbi:MAG TPA: tRNA lysidine(34) synthetase TilS [Bacteroidales bacterium]|nr:tRNA lysidine(34) synthetase TilS [Bacteroidales bacterium]HOK99841.1 tRNA lysidine(34) synthetase TilS [Bacteroidales bacterium]HPO66634.1 tRNA lysidine(34) synthetase TilS [Bacteroidales bacterium]
MSLLQRFEHYLRKECSVDPAETILIAVSGGADSMCLLHLLHTLRQPVAAVHCNFQLRGKESDEDEAFVKQHTHALSIPLHVKKFDTLAYARSQGITIQEAARKLRYDYFEHIRQLHHYQCIATAHHADDSIETFFINLLRGTGLKGITGIKPRQGLLIRPLLFAFRHEIEQYCTENNIEFRTDSSNLSDKYLRNQLRHHIIPAFERINPAFRQIMLRNLDNFKQAEKIYQHYITHEINKIPQRLPDNTWSFPIHDIKQQPSPTLALHELLQPFNFSPDTIYDIVRALDRESGKEFFSPTHRLIKDRDLLLVEPIESEESAQVFYIEPNTQEITFPIKLTFQWFNAADYKIKADRNIAALDADKIEFPLMLRHWQKGDYFIPLGMKNFKKLSDFFIDLKLSRLQKERTWLLTNGDEIVWIVGIRIDERYKITPQTKHVIEIRLNDL